MKQSLQTAFTPGTETLNGALCFRIAERMTEDRRRRAEAPTEAEVAPVLLRVAAALALDGLCGVTSVMQSLDQIVQVIRQCEGSSSDDVQTAAEVGA